MKSIERLLTILLLAALTSIPALAKPKSSAAPAKAKPQQILKNIVTGSPWYEVKEAALIGTYPVRHPIKTFHFFVF